MEHRQEGLDANITGEIESNKISREEVMTRLERDQTLEDLDLTDLDLSGLDLKGVSFTRSDIRGLNLYADKMEGGKILEVRTDISGTDFTDATFADMGVETFFGRVKAEGATFGFSENLIDRRRRLKESGSKPTAKDCGGYFNFVGQEGNFKNSRWNNIDFGGGSGYEADLSGADLSGARISGSDLSGIDLSTVDIKGVKIIDPLSLNKLIINEDQIDDFLIAIELTEGNSADQWHRMQVEMGHRTSLTDFFGIKIIETENNN